MSCAVPVRLPREPGARTAGGSHSYRVAEVQLVSELPIAGLAPFEIPGGAGTPASPHPPAEAPVEERAQAIFSADGWVGGEMTRVESRAVGDGYEIEVDGVGRFRVSSAAGIECVRRDPRVSAVRLAEALLGPALMVALALRGVYCLHASAVARGAVAVAFAGGSGVGKSTLAAELDRRGRWRRLTDDVTPTARRAGGPAVLARFPQLKLAAGEQTVAHADRIVPLGAVCIVEPPAGGEETVRLERLPPAEATWLLCRHTVASVLFASDLAERHLEARGDLATAVPVYRLVYPHRPDSARRTEALVGQALSC